MQALVFTGDAYGYSKDWKEPDPTKPLVAKKKFGDGHVVFAPEQLAVIRPMRVGICGTDLAIMDGHHGSAPPVVLGHEIVGVVEYIHEAAETANGILVGDVVGVDANVPCGVCTECVRMAYNRCLDLTTAGIFFDGGMAEQMVIPASQLVWFEKEDHAVDWDVLALFEPASCVMHGMSRMKRHADFPKGGDALVFGAGPIGLLWVLALQAEGCRVTVSEPSDYRGGAALRIGATSYDASTGALNELEAKGFDIIVDASGVVSVTEDMVSLARNGAFLNLFGQQKSDAVVDAYPIVEANQKELTIVGSYATNGEFLETLDFLQQDLPFSELISHRFALKDAKEGFAAMRAGKSQKVLIYPQRRESV